MQQILLVAVVLGLSANERAHGQVPTVDHVFVLVEENQDFSIVIGQDSPMLFLNELASRYGIAASYYATAHPSIVNYFMLTTGIAIGKDIRPRPLADLRIDPVDDDNVIRILNQHNKTWRSYAEGLPWPGYTGGNRPDLHYVKRHNPLAYFEHDFGPTQAQDNLVPFPQLKADLANGTLPNYSFIVPNLLNDAHNVLDSEGKEQKARCGDRQALKSADDWLRQHIAPLIDAPLFKERGLLVILFDEACDDDESDGMGHGDSGGRVAMLVIGSRVKPGYRSIAHYSHEDVLALTLEALGIDHSTFPGAARTAKPMAEFFQ